MNPMSTAHESSDTVVRNLSKRYEIYNTPRDRLKQLVLPHLYQAAKRFEFTYEMAWKALKRVLDYLGIDARAPRPVFKEAYAQGFLAEEQVWLDMIEMRNLSSHVYDEHEISRILERLDRYLSAFEGLLEKLRNIVVPNEPAQR